MISYEARKLCVFVLMLTLSFIVNSQNLNEPKKNIDLFEIDDNISLKVKYFKEGTNTEGELLNLNITELNKLLKNEFKELVIKLPIQGKMVDLNLKKSNFIVKGAVGKTIDNKFRTNLENQGVHYWGTIIDADYSNSILAFSFFEDKVYGLVSGNMGNYSLYKLNDETNIYAFYKKDNELFDLECATDDNYELKEAYNESSIQSVSSNISTLDYPINISMNANSCVVNSPYQGNGSIIQTLNLMLSHFNFYALIFANEEISIRLSEIVLEASLPSGSGVAACLFTLPSNTEFYGPGMVPCQSGDTHYLSQFQNILGNTYDGDYAYMYVNSSCYAAGRAATIGAFCNSSKLNRMGVGLVPNFSQPIDHELPDYFHRLSLFPHELGHLLGATHTFCSSTPYFNIMLSGNTSSCFNTDIDFRRGFGVERGNTIRNNILNNIGCFSESSVCEQENLFVFHRIEDLGNVDYSAFYKAQTITADNYILNSAEAIYQAQEFIELIPGFEVEENSVFKTKIELCIDNSNSKVSIVNSNKEDQRQKFKYEVLPTLVENNVSILSKKENIDRMAQIKIYDFFGQEVFAVDKINSDAATINLNRLIEGIYVLKVFNDKGENIHTQKIIKK